MISIDVIKNQKEKSIKVEVVIFERDQNELRHFLRKRGYKLIQFTSTYYKYYCKKDYIDEYFKSDIKTICNASNKYRITDSILKGVYTNESK